MSTRRAFVPGLGGSWEGAAAGSSASSPQFRREEDAEKAVIDLNNRWFNGQPIHAELSPVTDFREACCRQYEMG